PRHLDVVELAPILGGLLALGAPGGLQAGVGEGGLERLLGAAGGLAHLLRQRRVDAEPGQRGGGHAGRRALKEAAAVGPAWHGCCPPRFTWRGGYGTTRRQATRSSRLAPDAHQDLAEIAP